MNSAGYITVYIVTCYQFSLISSYWNSNYTIRNTGSPNTKDHRIYFLHGKEVISPYHDIPLYADKEKQIFNMIVEIPRWTNAKMEMNMQEPLNPIKQDLKDGELRYVANLFPYHGYIWNYGAMPQTWEIPLKDKRTGYKGDNDPLDVIEIGEQVAEIGSVIQVKVLGAIALIDSDETDWKIIAINVNDPKAQEVKDILLSDFYTTHFPNLLHETCAWFKKYKIPSGGKPNKIEFGMQPRGRGETIEIITEMHNNWIKLINEEVDMKEISCKHVYHNNIKNTTKSNNCRMTQSEAKKILKEALPEAETTPIFMEVDKLHYVANE